MKDILGRELQDFDIISFPFLKREGYRGSKVSVCLTVGILKGERVYTINDTGKYTYKAMKNPEEMAQKLPEDELTETLQKKIADIRVKMSEKRTRK